MLKILSIYSNIASIISSSSCGSGLRGRSEKERERERESDRSKVGEWGREGWRERGRDKNLILTCPLGDNTGGWYRSCRGRGCQTQPHLDYVEWHPLVSASHWSPEPVRWETRMAIPIRTHQQQVPYRMMAIPIRTHQQQVPYRMM